MDTIELIDNIRGFLDEDNSEAIDNSDILQALNRASSKAANIAARKYEDMFWVSVTIETVGGQEQYEIPKAAYGQRIELIEVRQAGISRRVDRISNGQRSRYISRATQSALPLYYSLQKNVLQFYPAPTAGIIVDIHYNQRPEKLVLPQGRITSFDDVNTKLIVDKIGEDLTTEIGGYGAFANIIDFTTGAVKGTLQIMAIDEDTNEIEFKTAGLDRDRVLLKTISTALPPTIEEDDYICLVTGTCVPEMPDAYVNFLIQHAVVSLKRRLGEDVGYELEDLRQAQEELEKMFAGRQQSHRVNKTGSHFSSPVRRYIT